MVDVSYENHTGIIQVRATAFTPEDAQKITRAVLEKSGTLVNDLAEQAREDAMRFAQEDLGEAEANLRDLRQELASSAASTRSSTRRPTWRARRGS